MIAVSDVVYMQLARVKGKLSFNELLKSIVETSKRRGDPKEFEKLFGILGDEGAEELRKASKEFRRNFKVREFKDL
jgi:predicted CopG family antitoxin